MKINSNIAIFGILTLFVTSNVFLYNYLNDGYFIDKKPDAKPQDIENIIFSLIDAHELVLMERNAAILAEAERLRDMRLNTTDSAELKAIEDQLRALEEESKSVLERVKNSENERRVAEKQSENDQLQLTELLESNSRMGAALDSINEEFDSYVTTIEETLKSNSYSEEDINKINIAFSIDRGLNYLNDLVANIQQNKSLITKNFTQQLKDRSDAYYEGLKEVATELGDRNFTGNFDDNNLLIPNESINNLKTSIDKYKSSRDRELINKERELKSDLENQLAELKNREFIKRNEAIADLNLEHKNILAAQKEAAIVDKRLSLEELENRLRQELVAKESIVKVNLPTPDLPYYTNWVHIPGLWTSSFTEVTYSGKKIDSIAWSRSSITDNQSISFNGQFDPNGECLIILYGDGRFKSWDNGLIISIKSIGSQRGILSLIRNGIDEDSDEIYSNSITMEGSLSGSYYIIINESKLTIYHNAAILISDYPINLDLNGKIGFANREKNSSQFVISNIKLLKIR